MPAGADFRPTNLGKSNLIYGYLDNKRLMFKGFWKEATQSNTVSSC
jgi:hypothetical protein